MNISNLGATCYKHFDRYRVMKALNDIKGMHKLQLGQISREQTIEAKDRANFRLKLYYEHLQGLIQSINHADRDKAIDLLKNIAEEDANRISTTYEKITSFSKKENIPGIALFLHTGNRSFALLPKMLSTLDRNGSDTVYMSSLWSQTIFELESEARNNSNDLERRIKRSNRLWQRERWSVLPAADTLEPFDKPNPAYFNNIALHKKAVDGWVDAFWGVQSGIRLPIPIPDSEGSFLVILFTSYIPDLFKEWEESSNTYPKQMPNDLANQTISHLEQVFKEELKGLSLATNLLKDVVDSETTLLNAGMKMLAHYVHGQPNSDREKLNWEKRVINLLHGLRQISEDQYKSVSDLENPMEAVFNRLENLSHRLSGSKFKGWKAELEKIRKKKNQMSFTLLPHRNCKVGDVISALQSLQKSRQSSVTLTNDAESNSSYPIDSIQIHPYLLTAVLDNLVAGKNVHITLTVKNDPYQPEKKLLQITAFYPDWRLTTSDEQDFLLKPLTPIVDKNARRNGFYLTAQVLWRNNGLIEYYPLFENLGSSQSALINLTFKLDKDTVNI